MICLADWHFVNLQFYVLGARWDHPWTRNYVKFWFPAPTLYIHKLAGFFQTISKRIDQILRHGLAALGRQETGYLQGRDFAGPFWEDGRYPRWQCAPDGLKRLGRHDADTVLDVRGHDSLAHNTIRKTPTLEEARYAGSAHLNSYPVTFVLRSSLSHSVVMEGPVVALVAEDEAVLGLEARLVVEIGAPTGIR